MTRATHRNACSLGTNAFTHSRSCGTAGDFVTILHCDATSSAHFNHGCAPHEASRVKVRPKSGDVPSLCGEQGSTADLLCCSFCMGSNLLCRDEGDVELVRVRSQLLQPIGEVEQGGRAYVGTGSEPAEDRAGFAGQISFGHLPSVLVGQHECAADRSGVFTDLPVTDEVVGHAAVATGSERPAARATIRTPRLRMRLTSCDLCGRPSDSLDSLHRPIRSGTSNPPCPPFRTRVKPAAFRPA